MADMMENKAFQTVDENGDDAINVGNIERFLTFVSDGLHFGVSTEKVIEIINNHVIRSFPMVPDFVRGIINLRGQVIPIIDMRLRVGKPYQEYTPQTCIIILEIDTNIIGVVVDSVAQVIDINLDEITPIPTENRLELTKTMYKAEDGSVILLLECDAVINA